MPKFDALQASLKAAAVGGIFMIWANFTIKAFKLSWDIISLPEKDTYKPVVKFMCQNCGEIYDDDEEKHVIDGVLWCDLCRLEK